MRIGELARAAGISVDTVRFYERRGLLPQPSRAPSDYRDYSRRSLDRLRLICESKQLGFTLGEIGAMLRSRAARPVDCEVLRKRAEQKTIEIDRKIRQLRSMRQALRCLVRECDAARGECASRRAFDRGAQ